MSILSDARALSDSSSPGVDCQVRKALHDHPALADEIAEALRDHSIHAGALARTLANYGINVGAQAIGRHRRGDCRRCGGVW